MTVSEYKSISVSKWLSDNISLAGFGNPTKNAVMSVRELVENSLDATEGARILPDINISVKLFEGNIYEVRIADNGIGVPKEYVANAFGKVLFGSKFTLKQHRGIFGAGGKLVLINSQRETRMPFTIISSTVGSSKIYSFTMEVDINRNEPIVHSVKEVDNSYNWHGTIVKFYSKADFSRALNTIVKYLQLTNVVCPYASIKFTFNDKEVYSFKRVTDLMPEVPREVKWHPHGVDAETVRELISSCDKNLKLSDFLVKCFQRVGYNIAKRFLQHYNLEDVAIGSLTDYSISKLADYLKDFDEFISPTTECLSVIGEDILRQSLFVRFEPLFVCYSSRKGVYSGHPFIVECALAYGGKHIEKLRNSEKDSFILYRFANRIPLLYDESSCVLRKVLNDINKNAYRLTEEDTVLFVANLSSTKVPYKTIGKECISDAYENVNHAVKLCYQDVLRKLKEFVIHKKKYEANVKRKSVLKKYLEHISFFVCDTLGKDKINIDEILKNATKEASS